MWFCINLGGTTFELRHALGETDDATWVWMPELKTVCVSDLWVWSCPNVGNPFKVQRFALGWAEALEAVAALSPDLMLPGHGAAIAGAEEIKDGCLTVARALRFLDDQVVGQLDPVLVVDLDVGSGKAFAGGRSGLGRYTVIRISWCRGYSASTTDGSTETPLTFFRPRLPRSHKRLSALSVTRIKYWPAQELWLKKARSSLRSTWSILYWTPARNRTMRRLR